MEIKGFIDISLVDWDGKISSVIFLPNCNMRCPFCYNATLVLHPDKLPTIPLEEIENYLKKNRKWIDGVVITGGEPTIHSNLPDLCQKIKRLGLMVKLDTNGTNPTMARRLIDKELVDYIAMDVKAPLTEEKYSKASGVNAKILLQEIEENIDALLEFNIAHEFRTTVVPTLHRKEDIEEICRKIKDCQKYAIQNYKTQVDTIDPKFKELKPFPERRMKAFLETAKKIIPNTILRG
ncbi:MAG: anaerobic ribonucleoside-triphosphate reductase activating protein [Candidatus Bathyarchaeia archaeon]